MRWLLILLGLWHGGNGLWMTLRPLGWFATVPGVTDTGAANAHFITDVGLGFLAAGGALLLAAQRPAAQGALVLVALVFLGGHGLVHLFGLIAHPSGGFMRDTLLILLPGFLPLAVYLKGARA